MKSWHDDKTAMIARFYYNIPRCKGRYGTAVAVFSSREEMLNGGKCYMRTYKFQNPDEERAVDTDAQVAELRLKVLRKYPEYEFIN